MDQQTVTIQDGTELITLGTQLNPNVHFIKTDAVLGSAAIILHSQGTGSSGQQQIQYTLQPDMLVGTSSEGQPTPGAIYFTGNPYAIDQSASQAAQILSAFKFEDLYHNPPQQAKLVPSSGMNLCREVFRRYIMCTPPSPTTTCTTMITFQTIYLRRKFRRVFLSF
jgi:hypothetical protein